ncbi:MAG TPA: tetratricopeptide repeat protein [Chloroflexota bacterium]|nr:tetratricopeptide repeat protein [Chloroflexota bacterium]
MQGAEQDLVKLGCSYAVAEQLDEAAGCFQAVVAVSPENAYVRAALGRVLQMQHKLDEAAACYQRALELDPGNPWFHTYLGTLLLLRGHFDECWRELEWFWQTSLPIAASLKLGKPRWDGSPLAGRTILLQAPLGGFGDNVMWARYASHVAARGGTVIVQCPPELARLLQGLTGVRQVVARGEPLPAFDVHAPLMSLAHLLGMPHPNQAGVPYLPIDYVDSGRWAQALAPRTGMRVGLAWATDPTHPAARRRSIAMGCLAPLADIGGVTFFSLQKGLGAEQLATLPPGLHVVDIGRQLMDFADTAAVLNQLDLVITVDTVVAHLAGALGLPVWILLASRADARWLLDREDSPWYPSARLFRQAEAWDWVSVIERVACELATLSADR